jgi:hypothetical protein
MPNIVSAIYRDNFGALKCKRAPWSNVVVLQQVANVLRIAVEIDVGTAQGVVGFNGDELYHLRYIPGAGLLVRSYNQAGGGGGAELARQSFFDENTGEQDLATDLSVSLAERASEGMDITIFAYHWSNVDYTQLDLAAATFDLNDCVDC